MATIDQLKLSALANARIGQAGYTAASSAKGSFKQILKSVVKAPESLEAIFSEASEKIWRFRKTAEGGCQGGIEF